MAKRAGLLGEKYTAAEEQDSIKKLLAGEGNLSADDQAGLKILEEQRKLISGIGNAFFNKMIKNIADTNINGDAIQDSPIYLGDTGKFNFPKSVQLLFNGQFGLLLKIIHVPYPFE